MTEAADDAVTLYGTEQPAQPRTILRAGPLTAELDAGNLRHIRVGAIEVIRAISFIVRDRHWGTYDPLIGDLHVDQRADGFIVHYRAEAKDDQQSFTFHATIDGQHDRITFAAEGAPAAVFETCRTGFVVLHPVNGVAGELVTIEHVDGSMEIGRFPDLIDPIQPMMDLRALTHEATPGLKVTCRMEGDTFEMEDQRNWCDASFKTYVRPLSWPWPYTLAAGEAVYQSVSLAIDGRAPRAASASGAVRVTVGNAIGPAPALGLGYDPAEAEATRRVLPQLAELRPHILVCHFDPRCGHDRASLEAAVSIAIALGAEPWLEVVIAEVDGFAAEIAAVGALVQSLGSPFRAVLLSPAADLKSTTPGQPWPPAPSPAAFYQAARDSFPSVRLGGGMISTFTELNRKRPPLDHLDFVSFTTTALIHACDDVSVIEGLEALPSIARSAQAIAQHLPIVVGPSSIGLRLNPYGVTPVPNPANKRQVMALNDPRQRARLGAAWAVGYYARLACAGVQTVVLGQTTGPFGVLHTTQVWPTPGYNREGTAYPIFQALLSLARLRGAALYQLNVSEPEAVEGVAADRESGFEVVMANLTAHARQIQLGDQFETIEPFGLFVRSIQIKDLSDAR